MAPNIFEDVIRVVGELTGASVGTEAAVGVSPSGLEASADGDIFAQQGRVAFADSAAVYHDKGAIVTCGSHDDARHILITARYTNVGVMVLGTSQGLYAIGNDFARLEGKSHAFVFGLNPISPLV